MSELEILCGTKMELWHGLVKYGVKLSGQDLSDELEHYLITVFDRTFEPNEKRKSFINGSVVMMLSEAQGKEGLEKREALRFVGDTCMMRAGFSQFISRTFKKIESNPRQYYMNMGIASFMMLYAEYENRKQRNKGWMYQLVAHNLHSLVEVLSSIENHEVVVENLQKTTEGNVTYL